MHRDRVEIGDFRPADQYEVRWLILRGLGEHWGLIDESKNPDLDDIHTSYGHGRTIVARLNDEIVGTGTIVPVGDDRVELVRMSVAESVRRTGLGRLMVETLVETARDWGASVVVLETTTAWTDVVAFYLSCGFGITRTVEGEFGSETWFERIVEQAG